MVDFTDCEIDIEADYKGSDQKYGIIYNGQKYMLKLADKVKEEKRNDLNSSYSNSVFSEHLCCQIYRQIGIDVQDTIIGYIRRGNENKPVVACRNFIPNDYELVEFKTIANATLERKPGKVPKINEIYDVMMNGNAYFDSKFGEKALERYWDTFVVDALLGNFDRHANNWGYLINGQTKDVRLAPIYDCGSCMYPQMADDAIPNILASEEEISMRVEKFPTAALIEDKRKVNYKDFICSLHNDDCNEALKRIFPKINMDKIADIIDNMEGITDERKEFYLTMLNVRYERILEPAYKALTLGKSNRTNKKGKFDYTDD